MDELLELIGLGIVAIDGPIIYYHVKKERKKCRQRVERAEEFLQEGELGKAYEEVKDVVGEGVDPYASRKTKRRAREIAKHVDTKLRNQLRSEVKEGLGKRIEDIDFRINLERGIFEIPIYSLKDFSETYRKQFIGE
jgi:hypothetical protein